jgi:hypothetical protein
MSRTLMSLVALIVAVYLVLCAALFFFQRSLIYFPQPNAVDSADSRLKLAMPDAQVSVITRERVGRGR